LPDEKFSYDHIQNVFSNSLPKVQAELKPSESSGFLKSLSSVGAAATTAVYKGFLVSYIYTGTCSGGNLLNMDYQDLSKCIYRKGRNDTMQGYNLVSGMYYSTN
jgi:hypothetical protein